MSRLATCSKDDSANLEAPGLLLEIFVARVSCYFHEERFHLLTAIFGWSDRHRSSSEKRRTLSSCTNLGDPQSQQSVGRNEEHNILSP